MELPAESNTDDARARQHIIQAAVACFRRLGYSAATVNDIAAEAGLPPAAVQFHFASNDALALALVQAKIDQLVTQVDSLAPGALADRYSEFLSLALRVMSQDREVVMAVFAHALVDDAEFDIMSGSSAQRLTASLQRLVLASDDALRAEQARDMSVALFATLMLVLIFWCYDRTPAQEATENLLGLVRELFAQMRPLYFLPILPQAIARLARIVQPPPQSASVSATAQEDARDGEHQDFNVHGD